MVGLYRRIGPKFPPGDPGQGRGRETACIGPLPLALAEALLAVVAAGQCELGSTDEARGFPRAIRNSPLFGTIPVWETAE